MLQHLSVQLYSLRGLPDLADQLRLVKRAGLDAVETTSANYDDPDRLHALLGELGLRAPSGHVGLPRLRADLDGTRALAERLGMRLLVVWGLPEAEQPASAAGWEAAGAELGAMATGLARHGVTLAFHNHDWELGRQADGRLGLDHLFEGAGAAPLRWQADLAWLARGGGDVPALLEAHADRLVSAHVKDLASAGEAFEEDGWADLGFGVLPWADWWARLRRLGVDPVVLEHDAPSDPERFLTRSAAAARRLP